MPHFRHLPVHSFEDVTHDLEQLESERAGELQGVGTGPSSPLAYTVALLYRKAKQKVKAGLLEKLELDTALKDPGGNYVAAKHCYVAPVEGYYSVQGEFNFGENLGGVLASLNVNAVQKARGSQGTAFGGTVSATVFVKAKDEIQLYVLQESGVEKETVESSGEFNYLHVVRVA